MTDGYRDGLEAAAQILAEQREKWEAKAERTAAKATGRSRAKTLAAQRVRAAAYKAAGDRIRTELNRHAKRQKPADAGAMPSRLRGTLARLGI